MKKVIRLKESDLARIVRRTIKESEQEALMQTIESDPKMSNQFDKIVDYLSNLDPEQQQEIESVISDANQSQGEYTEGKETKYYDYGGDRPQEISKSHFIKRKLMSILPPAIVGAIMGIAMAGGTSATDVLEMALGMAASMGAIGAGLISTVGRKKVDVPDEESDETSVTETYRRKRTIKEDNYDLIDHDFRQIKNGLFQAKDAINNGDTDTASHIIEVLGYKLDILHKSIKK